MEEVVEDLKTLPEEKQQEVADYVRALKQRVKKTRAASLRVLSELLTASEVDEMNRVIEQGCEQVDDAGW